MSSTDYVQTARRLIRENADLFDALLEYERTKKIPKLSRKKRVNFTVDADLVREFRREAAKRGVAMSAAVEQGLRTTITSWRKGRPE